MNSVLAFLDILAVAVFLTVCIRIRILWGEVEIRLDQITDQLDAAVRDLAEAIHDIDELLNTESDTAIEEPLVARPVKKSGVVMPKTPQLVDFEEQEAVRAMQHEVDIKPPK